MTFIRPSFSSFPPPPLPAPLSPLSGGGGGPWWGNTAKDWADLIDNLQSKTARTRLGIPLVYGADAVHGHNNVWGATVFPHHVGLGATRDAGLVKRVAEAAALVRGCFQR